MDPIPSACLPGRILYHQAGRYDDRESYINCRIQPIVNQITLLNIE